MQIACTKQKEIVILIQQKNGRDMEQHNNKQMTRINILKI